MDHRLAALETRLRALEDERAIHQLIAAYGPLVDDGAADEVAQLWTHDGVYDVDGWNMAGRTQIAEMVQSDGHQGYINRGSAHFLGPAHVTVDGDQATATCHSLLVLHHEGRFVVERATAHHWALVRTPDGWQVQHRTSRMLDGKPDARGLLSAGVRGHPAQTQQR